jgi:penicillin-binding protein 1A
MMGIMSKLLGVCAETLGGLTDGVSPLEMADAYATIASGGYRNRPRVIKKVITREGKSELPGRWRVHRVKAFEDGVTYEATKILEDNVAGGTGTHAQIGCPQGGKTGTTDHNIDAWFVGFTPRMATAVWVGFPGNAQISMNGMYRPTGGNIDGGTYPADIWGEYMKKAVGKFCGDFPKPKEPFASQPFFGHYSREGVKGDEKGPGATGATGTTPTDPTNPPQDQTGTATPAQPTPTPAKGTDHGKHTDNKGTTYDPSQYETQPQGQPQTGTAGGGTKAPGDG